MKLSSFAISVEPLISYDSSMSWNAAAPSFLSCRRFRTDRMPGSAPICPSRIVIAPVARKSWGLDKLPENSLAAFSRPLIPLISVP